MKLLRYLFIAIFFFIWGLNSYKPLTRYLDEADRVDPDSVVSKSWQVLDTLPISRDTITALDSMPVSCDIMYNGIKLKPDKPKKKKKKEPSVRLIRPGSPIALVYDSSEFVTPDSIRRQIQVEDSMYIRNQKRREISKPG